MARPNKGTTARDRFNARYYINAVTGCWLWTGCRHIPKIKNNLSYGFLKIGQRNISAHRFSYEENKGPIPYGMLVLHKCDTPLCVNPDHLFLGTQRDNMRDCADKDRHSRGERSGKAKLTDERVRQIKRDYKPWSRNQFSMNALARREGISVSIISDIIHGKRWKHIAAPQ